MVFPLGTGDGENKKMKPLCIQVVVSVSQVKLQTFTYWSNDADSDNVSGTW